MDSTAMSWREHIRQNMRLALLLMIGKLATNGIWTSDNTAMGWIDRLSLAASALASRFYLPFFFLTLGISLAVSPLVAQRIGAGDDDRLCASLCRPHRLYRHDPALPRQQTLPAAVGDGLARLLRIGVPIGLTIVAEASMFIAVTFLIGLFGTAALAAAAIANLCRIAGATFWIGIAGTAATMVILLI